MSSRWPRREVIELDDLPATVRGDYGTALGPAVKRNDTLRAWASRYVRLVLHRADGNKRMACDMLGISYHTLNAYLRFPVHGEAPSVDAPDAGADEDVAAERAI